MKFKKSGSDHTHSHQLNSGHFEDNPSPVKPRSFGSSARNAGMRSGDRWSGGAKKQTSGGGRGSGNPDGSASMTGGSRYNYGNVKKGTENTAPRSGNGR